MVVRSVSHSQPGSATAARDLGTAAPCARIPEVGNTCCLPPARQWQDSLSLLLPHTGPYADFVGEGVGPFTFCTAAPGALFVLHGGSACSNTWRTWTMILLLDNTEKLYPSPEMAGLPGQALPSKKRRSAYDAR